MHTRIQKWGNSLALRIPRSLAAAAQVEEGSTVDVSVESGTLRIRPVRARRYLLLELLREVTPRNLHAEIKSGGWAGRRGDG